MVEDSNDTKNLLTDRSIQREKSGDLLLPKIVESNDSIKGGDNNDKNIARLSYQSNQQTNSSIRMTEIGKAQSALSISM